MVEFGLEEMLIFERKEKKNEKRIKETKIVPYIPPTTDDHSSTGFTGAEGLAVVVAA